MADWITKLDDFLRLSDSHVLTHAGKISHKLAEEHAHAQFEQFNQQRQALANAANDSDFDQAARRLTEQPAEKKPSRRRKNKSGDRPPEAE